MKYLLSLLILLPLTVNAERINGKALHDSQCMSCHTSSVYTRDDKRVLSITGLNMQVGRCHDMLGKAWTDEQTMSVVNYLNDSFYHF